MRSAREERVRRAERNRHREYNAQSVCSVKAYALATETHSPVRVANEATICIIRAKKLLSVQKDKDAADAMVSLNLRGSDKQKHTRVIQRTLWPL